MNINHRPIFDTEKVCELYSKKDGVPVTYVCTTALGDGAHAMDVFYRETPHPEFGNRYFGLYWTTTWSGAEQMMITNADQVEDLKFEMIDAGGAWQYSRHRHDYFTVGGVSIDGGRAYLRLVGDINVTRAEMRVVDGKFVMETLIDSLV